MIKSYNKKKLICGIDEAGRGALAGPVTISAVILPKSYHNEKIKDSKRLSKKKRLELFGGTGESFNWELLKNSDNDTHNFVLSGGINSQNVDNALKTNSWCLDLNSGVESQAGIKDIHLIKDILKTIRNYGV